MCNDNTHGLNWGCKQKIHYIFQWQFLARDEGEVNIETDAGWMEDEGMICL